jgi:hypothetical protein
MVSFSRIGGFSQQQCFPLVPHEGTLAAEKSARNMQGLVELLCWMTFQLYLLGDVYDG